MTEPLPDRRRLAGVLPGPAGMLGLLSLVLGLVAVVALASGGGRAGGGTTEPRGPSTLFWDYLFTMSVLAAVVGGIVSIWLMKQQIGAKAEMDRKGRHMLVFVFLASLVLGVVIAVQFARADRNALRERGGGSGSGAAQDRFGKRDREAGPPSFLWGP